MNDKTFIEMIRDGGISGIIIKAILDDREGRKSIQSDLYERYKTSSIGVPIKTRKYTVAGKELKDKINNQINNDFFGDIIDVKVGFFVGYPITYALSMREMSESEYKKSDTVIQDFIKAEHCGDIDAEMVKSTSICGESGRMLYIGVDGEPHILNLFPWELTVLYTGNDPVYALYGYDVEIMEVVNKATKKTIKKAVEFYDETYRYLYHKEKDDFVFIEKEVHGFSGCPLFTVKNNKEEQGDGEKVLKLIDAYDRVLSDWDNEIEQFRLAYLKVCGADLKKEAIEKAKETGVFILPGKDSDINYIIKQLSVEAVEKILDRIEENIYHFAKSINSRDKNFAGTITGVALSHKMTPLEGKCLIMERKITTAFRHQFKLLCDIWAVRNLTNINYLDIEFTFQRKYPQNLQAEAEMVQKFMGTVSQKTLLENISIVKDVEEEIKRIEEEAGVDLESIDFTEEEDETIQD